jgi:cell wall assembly regulator SMI1/predicted DNA-binding WGR domain protein
MSSRFEFEDGRSHKFWEVSCEGKSLRIRFGRIGSTGQTKVKSFATPEQAKRECERAIREKTGKGYRKVSRKSEKGTTRTGSRTKVVAVEMAAAARPSATAIAKVWRRIEAWLLAHAPALAGELAPGATVNQIAQAERTLGFALPVELRDLLEARNGGKRVFAEHDLLSAAEVARTNRDLYREFGKNDRNRREGTPKVKAGWWNPRWVPFVATAGGDLFCIDLDPGPRGRVGQIIEFEHEDSARRVVAGSLMKWLEAIARDLDAGLYGFDAKEGFTPPICGIGFGLSGLHGRRGVAIVRQKQPEFRVANGRKLLVQRLESVAPFSFARGVGKAAHPTLEVRTGRRLLVRWQLSRVDLGRESSRLEVGREIEGTGEFSVRVSGVQAWPCFVSYQVYGDRALRKDGKLGRKLSQDEVLERLEPLTDRLERAKKLPAFVEGLRAIVEQVEAYPSLGGNESFVAALVCRGFDGAKTPAAARQELFDLTLSLVAAASFSQKDLVEMAVRALWLHFETRHRAILPAFEQTFMKRIETKGIKRLLNGGVLLFNLACAFGEIGEKQRMLHYVDVAMANGKTPVEFRVEMAPKGSLSTFRTDPDLLARVTPRRNAGARTSR